MRTAKLAAASLAVLASGCVSVSRVTENIACRTNEQAAIAESLYFGTVMPGGKAGEKVSPEDWQRFLADTVTPRFPEGLTHWPASGQWLSPTGELHKEDSYVLSIVHKDEPKYDAAVRDVIAAYRSRFKHEAVLRVRTMSCMSY